MHSVAKACAKGELTECGCEKSTSTNRLTRPRIDLTGGSPAAAAASDKALPTTGADGFEWGGCSDDLKFGRNVSTTFADGQEAVITRRRMIRMVNLHNNEAGRQVCRQVRVVFPWNIDSFLSSLSNEMFNWLANVTVSVVHAPYASVGGLYPISV